MTRRYSTNPIISYMQHHDWEWLTEEQITHATKCTPNDLQALLRVTCYRLLVEYRNGQYRYVSNLNSPRMKIIKALKSAYPLWLSGTEIQKRGDIPGSVGLIISRSGDLLPIAVRKEYRGKYQGTATLYQYLPNDPRSLMDFTYTDKEHRRMATRDTILDFLRNHPGKFYTAAEISDGLNASNASIIGNNMRVIRREHPSAITVEHRSGKSFYAYTISEAEPVEVTA